MSRLRILYLFSLVILGILAVAAVFRPLVTGREYSTVARESVLQDENQWIIQFDIVNLEQEDMNYSIVWLSGGQTYTESVRVGKGRIYSHIRHIYPETVRDNKVEMTIYREGESTPFEQVTYHLNKPISEPGPGTE